MPLRRCLDCPKLTLESRCPEHKRAHQRARDFARRGDPMRQLRRSAAWAKLSREAREAQPWCTRCGTTQDLTADHVVSPLRGGAPLDPANVQVLCRPCQNKKGDQQRR
jgi:5-methylcytosine-specific restriction enzyme A